MQGIMQIIAIGFITAVTSILLRATKPELSFVVTVTGVIVILLYIIESLQSTLEMFMALAKITGVGNGLLKALIKIVGVGYLTEFGVGILNDFGSVSVADKVALAGKITIILLALPIVEELLEMIQGFLQLA